MQNAVWRLGIAAAMLGALSEVSGQSLTGPPTHWTRATNIVVPQCRAFALSGTALRITQVEVAASIVGQTATTTMDIHLENPGGSRVEAELLVPVPQGAVVRGFAFQGNSAEPTARLLPADEARNTYQSLVQKIRDPALLEFAGHQGIRSSVFPVEAGGTQKVRLTYEHLLIAEGNRIDFVVPRSESVDYRVPWRISVRLQSDIPIATVYSPSHLIDTQRIDPSQLVVRTNKSAQHDPGAFRLSYLLDHKEVALSMYAYPDATIGGGYFLLLGGLPVSGLDKTSAIKREVTLVIDRSGSMRGDKIKQAREAALQILSGLGDGEAFNIIGYQTDVEKFSERAVIKDESSVASATKYLEAMFPGGGTNLHDALSEALRPKPMEGVLPIVLFLTDGLPTVGETSERAIRDLVDKHNPHQRRVFTFGVGMDVNTPLLEAIALRSRAKATFVLPSQDIEVAVGDMFRRLTGPVLADPKLTVLDDGGNPALGRVQDLIPNGLPDLFEGDQLVLLGRYLGDKPLTFSLSGNFRGEMRSFPARFTFDNTSTVNAFVPRLWASRRIASLIDQIRQMGADTSFVNTEPLGRGQQTLSPNFQELVDEIVHLSTKFGILTEYTAFLAKEGTDLSKNVDIAATAAALLSSRAMWCRTGAASVNQSLNNGAQLDQKSLKYRNGFLDEQLDNVEITSVQQINDRAFYKKGDRWIDSGIVEKEDADKNVKTIEFGSTEFLALVDRLTGQGRQGTVSLSGDILMVVDGQKILVKQSLSK